MEMTACQQVKRFCRDQGLTVKSSLGPHGRIVTISKRVVGDAWFIKDFDGYESAVRFLADARNAEADYGRPFAWTIANFV